MSWSWTHFNNIGHSATKKKKKKTKKTEETSGWTPRGTSYQTANPKWHLPKGCKRQYVDIRITWVLVRFSKVYRAPPTLTDTATYKFSLRGWNRCALEVGRKYLSYFGIMAFKRLKSTPQSAPLPFHFGRHQTLCVIK